MYAQFLKELPIYSKEGLQNIQGVWIKYPKESDAKALVQSLQGYTLEWCIANLSTAQNFLNGGDIHVFYSNDPMGNSIVPRLAIRMIWDSQIAENPRGIAPKQNLDPYILPVLEAKFKEFGSIADKYQKQASDMKFLTQIYQKWENKISLGRDELRFLYEIDGKIRGFGYDIDPRIQEILDAKDKNAKRKDLVFIFGCNPNQISFNENEALSGGIIYHWGNLDVRDIESFRGKFPKYIRGYLDLKSLKSYKGDFPKHVGGNLHLICLKSYKGDFPKYVGGTLNLESLESFEGAFPEHVGGDLDLESLQSYKGYFPKYVGRHLWLNSLESFKGNFPEYVGEYLNLESLESFKGNFPEYVGSSVNLLHLKSYEGDFPKYIGDWLDLRSLNSLKGNLPEYVGDTLYLGSLESFEGNFPKYVGSGLNLESLTSLEGNLPEHVGGKFI